MSRYPRSVRTGLAILSALLLLSCGSQSSPPVASRSYNLAFTPFPYALTPAALDYTYSRIASDADMIANHLASYGVPWPEALADTFPYNTNVMTEWETRRSRTAAGHRVYLALNAVNQARTGVAGLWSAAGANQALPAPWNGYALNDPSVKVAYLNYCRRAIAYFHPDYLTLSVEVNQIMALAPGVWPAYLDLQRSIYLSLKSIYPSLPIMVSLDANDLLGYRAVSASDQTRARIDVAAYSDYFCLSMYFYQGVNAGGSFPADAFDRLAAMTDKPIAICETGYPSQSFTLRVSEEPPVRSDPTAQKIFIDRLFQAADQYAYRFIVHFFLRDLDDSLDFSDTIRTYRYDGLYDASGTDKPALATWKQRLALNGPASTATDVAAARVAPAPGAGNGSFLKPLSRDSVYDALNGPGALSPLTRGAERAVRGNRQQPSASSSPPATATDPTAQSPAPAFGASSERGTVAMSFVYTNDNRNGPNTVSAFTIAPGGALTPVAGSPFETGGAGTGLWRSVLNDIVIAPVGAFIYVANHRSGDITAFSIDRETGHLNPIRRTPFSTSRWTDADMSLAVDPAGFMLFAANSESGEIAAFAVGSDGALMRRGVPVSIGGRPNALKVSPDGKFLGVTVSGDGRIAVLRIGADGSITPIAGSPFFGRFINAVSVDFGCANRLLYAATGAIGAETATTVEMFSVAGSGALEPIVGSPVRSGVGVNGGVLLLSPNNKLLFVTNQGLGRADGDTVTVFRVTDGGLSTVPGSPFPVGSRGMPVGMATTQSGQFLLTADYPGTRASTPSIGVFAVDPGGSLAAAPGSPFAVPGSSLASLATFPPARCAIAPNDR